MKKILLATIFFIISIVVFATEVDSIKISAVSEGFVLDGILLKKANQKNKMPVIVFLVGSGGNSSHTSNYKDFNQFFFEKTFLENGYAIVYFDKRGIGKSKGIWYETTFEQRALDAKNVAIELKKFDFVDTNKVFLVGHSQGGWIVQIALALYPEVFAGGISMAGATFGVKKQLINDYQSNYICNKGFEERDALKKATSRANRDLFFISLFGRKGNWKQLKLIKKFEPEPYLKKIFRPFLLLLGENDKLVDAKWCTDELKRLYPNLPPQNFEVFIAQQQTHSFKIAAKCYKGKSTDIYYSETTKQKIFNWINGQVGTN